MRYSLFNLVAQTFAGNRNWTAAWRKAEPKPAYDVVIVGGGGHGLATAYYLAKEYGIKNVAVVEKGYLGSGNVGRNTTIVRSNYLLPQNIAFYERSLKLWEGLAQELNFNTMVSQRGVINVFHSDPQRNAYVRRGNAMRLSGADAELLSRDQLRKLLPFADFDNARFPIRGGLMQRRGGTVRHDAVAWGYARAADALGVDIIENCEVTGIRIERGQVRGVETTCGFIGAGKIGLATAGNSSRVAAMAGLRLPIESHVIQAFVSEGLKPLIDQCRHLRRRTFLCEPVRQGRPRLRRRPRRLQLLCPARAICRWWRTWPRAPARCSPILRGSASCGTGAASSTCPWTARPSSTRRASAASISMAAGAMGASRRHPLQARALPV